MNTPSQKHIVQREFQEDFARLGKYWRSRGSQQIVSGTRELHERLLQTPLNRNSHKTVIGIYKDIAAGRV